ncbi:MAG: type IX secretion system anionic LPS delivery protein PorZ [Paludibacteraceae bacterium]
MKRNFLLLFFILFIGLSVQAQVAMGKWRTHFAYNMIDQIIQSDNKVFAISEGKLFSVDKRDGSMEFYSKLTGLSGIAISKIEYDDVNKILLIVYQDGNIDFMSSDGVSNLPDYYNKQMTSDKSINHIFIANNKAYLSCNFGIVTLNMLKKEIQDTYYIGPNASEVKVLNTTIYNGNIYAVSASNIYYASDSEPQLTNYEHWETMINLPGSGNFQTLLSFGSWLVLLRDGKLYKQASDGTWSDLDNSTFYKKINISENYLLAYTNTYTYIFDQLFVKNQINEITNINDGIYDNATSKFWFAPGSDLGIADYKINGTSPIINYYKPEGPAVNIPYRMKFAGEKLFVVPGEKWVGPVGRPGNIMIFENNIWKNISHSILEKALINIRVEDFTNVAVDPDDTKHFYVTSASSGIYEFKNDEFYMHYDRTNSPIETAFNIPDYYYQWTDNGTMDKDKNLWITNDLVKYGIKVLKPNGEWAKLDYSGVRTKQSLGQILISNQNTNQKWVLSRRNSPGICIFDDNGTIDTQSDDKSTFFSSFNYSTSDGVNSIAPMYYFCMDQEKNGTIWVGTDKGPLIFNNPSKAFESNFNTSRIIIPRNDGTGLGDFLLEDQHIIAIAIDGANRKWIGTESSGVYLMSENGQETIHHFTTQNSPLLSNNILSIAINPITGEVFFGTGNGLISYQSDAAEANNVFSNVHAYPNPVRENFNGFITITGLIENTQVKITDVAGNLIKETMSNGSIATWDGKNKWGEKVSTGVYLAVCVSPNGQQNATAKILIIN